MAKQPCFVLATAVYLDELGCSLLVRSSNLANSKCFWRSALNCSHRRRVLVALLLGHIV